MRFPEITSYAILAMFAITTIWLVLVVIAPFMVPKGTLTDLSGRVGYLDNMELYSELDPLPRVVYRIGDSQCHQIVERSYFLNENQMPFCARDFGLFIGLASASLFALFIRLTINPLWLLAGLVPIAIDGGLQMVTSYESVNALRLATGIVAGAALALLLAVFLLAFRNEDEESSSGSESEHGSRVSGKS